MTHPDSLTEIVGDLNPHAVIRPQARGGASLVYLPAKHDAPGHLQMLRECLAKEGFSATMQEDGIFVAEAAATEPDPTKPFALRRLIDAAEAAGWSVELPPDGIVLCRPSPSGVPIIAACAANGAIATRGPVPLDLMALLLEASR